MALGSKQDYKNALKALEPRGLIWQKKKSSLEDIDLDITAKVLASVHALAEKLPTEANLRTTRDMLWDWENVFELEHTGTYEERIIALLTATADACQTPVWYKEFCAFCGVEVEIREHCPFMFGVSSCGTDEIGAEDIIYYWEIIFLKGEDENIAKVKRLALKYNQAHTVLTFIDKRN